VALVRTDVLEELSASFIRVTRIGELGTTLSVTSNRCTMQRNTKFLQEPHGITSQKTPFFIVTAVKTSNLTCKGLIYVHAFKVESYSGFLARCLHPLAECLMGVLFIKALYYWYNFGFYGIRYDER
jgi:hypothetical protein